MLLLDTLLELVNLLFFLLLLPPLLFLLLLYRIDQLLVEYLLPLLLHLFQRLLHVQLDLSLLQGVGDDQFAIQGLNRLLLLKYFVLSFFKCLRL